MVAKYNGKCTRCGGSIRKGEQITWSRANGARHIAAVCETIRVRQSIAAGTADFIATHRDDDGLRWSARGQSGRGGYVTSSGRCEDAPCCGCCGTGLY